LDQLESAQIRQPLDDADLRLGEHRMNIPLVHVSVCMFDVDRENL